MSDWRSHGPPPPRRRSPSPPPRRPPPHWRDHGPPPYYDDRDRKRPRSPTIEREPRRPSGGLGAPRGPSDARRRELIASGQMSAAGSTRICFAYLLKGGQCTKGASCSMRHVAPEEPAAAALRIGDRPGDITAAGLSAALARASRDQLLTFFNTWGDQMDEQHLSNLWHKLGSQLRSDERRDGAGPPPDQAAGWGERERWIQENGEALARLQRRTIEIAPRCDAQALSNVVHGLAHAQIEAGPLFDAVAAAAVARLGEFTAQHTANTVWAFAKAGHEEVTLFDAVADAAVRGQMKGFNAQNIANTLWAFAKLGHAATALFAAAADMIVANDNLLRDFTAQGLAATAWAFAQADVRHLPLVAALTSRLKTPGLSLSRADLQHCEVFATWCRDELRLPEEEILSEGVSKVTGLPTPLARDTYM